MVRKKMMNLPNWTLDSTDKDWRTETPQGIQDLEQGCPKFQLLPGGPHKMRWTSVGATPEMFFVVIWSRAIFHSFYESSHAGWSYLIKGRIWSTGRTMDMPDLEWSTALMVKKLLMTKEYQREWNWNQGWSKKKN